MRHRPWAKIRQCLTLASAYVMGAVTALPTAAEAAPMLLDSATRTVDAFRIYGWMAGNPSLNLAWLIYDMDHPTRSWDESLSGDGPFDTGHSFGGLASVTGSQESHISPRRITMTGTAHCTPSEYFSFEPPTFIVSRCESNSDLTADFTITEPTPYALASSIASDLFDAVATAQVRLWQPGVGTIALHSKTGCYDPGPPLGFGEICPPTAQGSSGVLAPGSYRLTVEVHALAASEDFLCDDFTCGPAFGGYGLVDLETALTLDGVPVSLPMGGAGSRLVLQLALLGAGAASLGRAARRARA